jgi:hypothetical protein
VLIQHRRCKKDCVNEVLKKRKMGEPNDNQKRADRRVDRE